MKQENYLEGIYGCLERIEKKVETLPVEGTSPAVENRTNSPEGIAAVSYTHLDVYKRQDRKPSFGAYGFENHPDICPDNQPEDQQRHGNPVP